MTKRKFPFRVLDGRGKVMAKFRYDNDTALTRTFGVEYTPVRQIDGPFFDWGDDEDARGVVIA